MARISCKKLEDFHTWVVDCKGGYRMNFVSKEFRGSSCLFKTKEEVPELYPISSINWIEYEEFDWSSDCEEDFPERIIYICYGINGSKKLYFKRCPSYDEVVEELLRLSKRTFIAESKLAHAEAYYGMEGGGGSLNTI